MESIDKLEKLVQDEEWVVGENAKELLELLIAQNRTLMELVENLRKQIEQLDAQITVQSEIQQLRQRIEELERDNDPAPARTTPPAVGVCTPDRGFTYTAPADYRTWTSTETTGSSWDSTDSGSPYWSSGTVGTSSLNSYGWTRQGTDGVIESVDHISGSDSGMFIRILNEDGTSETFGFPHDAKAGTKVKGTNKSKAWLRDDGSIRVKRKDGTEYTTGSIYE